MNNTELKHNERLISVSYKTMNELIKRSEFIRERLKLHMSKDQNILPNIYHKMRIIFT